MINIEIDSRQAVDDLVTADAALTNNYLVVGDGVRGLSSTEGQVVGNLLLLDSGTGLSISNADITVSTGNIKITGGQLRLGGAAIHSTATGNPELVKFSDAGASAINEVTIANAIINNEPEISATGDDTHIDLKLTAKGTGQVVLDDPQLAGNLDVNSYHIVDANGNELLRFVATASAVNEVTITNQATNVAAEIKSTGEPNAALNVLTSGSGVLTLGNVGDILLGDGTLRVMYPYGDEKIDLGKVANRFNEVHCVSIKPKTSPTYTVTNDNTDRTYDADATTTAELADVVGTLIADLQALGVLS
jgi:hypothetical protein